MGTFRADTIKVSAMRIPCIDINKVTKSKQTQFLTVSIYIIQYTTAQPHLTGRTELPVTSISNSIIYVIATIKTSRNGISNFEVHNVNFMASTTFTRARTSHIFASSHLNGQTVPCWYTNKKQYKKIKLTCKKEFTIHNKEKGKCMNQQQPL